MCTRHFRKRTLRKHSSGNRLEVVLNLWFFFSSRRRHTRYWRDWSSDVCSSDLGTAFAAGRAFGDGPTDEDRLDLIQGFVDVSAPVAGGRATLRAGRQEVTLGSSRLEIGRASCRERV